MNINMNSVLQCLNDVVARDWKSMQLLVNTYTQTNKRMLEHATVLVAPVETDKGHVFNLGLMGIINGVLRNSNDEPLVEAVFDARNELMGFRQKDDKTPIPDYRAADIANLEIGFRYRVQDRAGRLWEGVYMGPRSDKGEGVHLRLDDGGVALIFFHDVQKMIHA